jgi:hypothetical protein
MLEADHAAAHSASCEALDIHILSLAVIRAGERGDGSRGLDFFRTEGARLIPPPTADDLYESEA